MGGQARLMLVEGRYPLVETAEGRVLILGRGGDWDDIEDPGQRAALAAREVDFDAFRDAVEALGGVVPDFV